MAKQVPKTKFLRVPDRQTQKEFVAEAKVVWKKRHPKGSENNRGRPSEARHLFELCDKVALNLMTDRQKKRLQVHRRHGKKLDKGELMETFRDCPICDTKIPPVSRESFREAITKYLDDEHKRLSKEAKKKKVRIPDKESFTDKTLDFYIWHWFRFVLHPEWMEKDIPARYRPSSGSKEKTRFKRGQVADLTRRKDEHQVQMDELMASNMIEDDKFDCLGTLAISPSVYTHSILNNFRIPEELRPQK